MINVNMKENFLKRNEELKEELRILQKKYSTISTLRIISFLSGAGLFIVGVADALPVAGIFGVIFLLFFAYLIKVHSDVVNKTEVTESMLSVVDAYINRYDDGWRNFSKTGKEYLTSSDTVSSDLDLLGDNSLFQMICVAHTQKGVERLVEKMKLENIDITDIPRRKEAIEELSDMSEFAIEYEAAGIRLANRKKKFKVEEFVKNFQADCADGIPTWTNVARVICPITFLVTLVLWIVGVCNYGVPLVTFLVILSFSWLTKTITDRILLPINSAGYGAEDYLAMMEIIQSNEFNSSLLADIKEGVCGKNGGIKAFRKLSQLSQAYNISFNPLIHQVLSGVCLWDYQLCSVVGKWKKRYGKYVATSFEYIGEMEELLSLSVLGMIRKMGYSHIDEQEKEQVKLSCENLYHPLILPETVVANSVNLNGGITIITGSNMSGKTTFLRTLAVNLALAYMGAPICGDSLNASYMKIFTSMRVTDDVANGISTFYAEILRIKSMAEYKKENKPMICLIDEIFKGTNSADRIVGATEAIKKLTGKGVMTLVSTHDFELCNITDEYGNEATNYHFEEYYENDELKFDYKIKDGRCTTTNAMALLKMAGF